MCSCICSCSNHHWDIYIGQVSMPMKPPRLCSKAGCSVRLHKGEVCPLHGSDRGGSSGREKRKGLSFDGVNVTSRAWRRLRLWVLRREPWCRVCSEPATEVDHLLPRKFGGIHARQNLQGLCKSCHSAKTAREKRCKTKDEWIQRESRRGALRIKVSSVVQKRKDVANPF